MDFTSVQISNWADVREQFGLEPNAPGHKTAKQLSKELTDKVLAEGVTKDKVFTIEYETNNIDSGIATFQYTHIINNKAYFDYTGTAK